MNYDKFILELFERVKVLEEKVLYLVNVETPDPLPLEDDLHENDKEVDKKITRKASRDYVMKQLNGHNPSFNVSKGNRATKADIIVTTTENKITHTLKAKFFHSKSFLDHVSGWHTVSKDDVLNDDIHMYIFNVEFEGVFHTFLFSRSEFLTFIKNKSTGQSNTYHFYFHIVNGRPIECRDDEKDVSKYLNNWKLPSKILS